MAVSTAMRLMKSTERASRGEQEREEGAWRWWKDLETMNEMTSWSRCSSGAKERGSLGDRGRTVTVRNPEESGPRDRVSKGFSMTRLVARLERH